MALRSASRLLVFDEVGERVLLFRYRRLDGSPFWATPGGGLQPTESFEQAAIREAREELGIDLELASIDRVGSQRIRFSNDGGEIEQEEHYFLLRSGPRLDMGRVETAHRAEGILEVRFWRRDEVERSREPVFPTELAKTLWDRAIALLNPTDVRAQIDAAYALDREGLEGDAARFYDQAHSLGVPHDERPTFLVGYGSTLRNVGRLEESEHVLRAAVGEYPEHDALPAFLALTLHSRMQHAEALAMMVDLLLRFTGHSPDLAAYARALAFYGKGLKVPS